MSTVFTPVFSLSASAVHNVQHTIYDLSESFPSTETAKTDSFNETSILRVKELRADKAGGIVKATELIVSNRPAISSGLVTKENLYEGQQDSKTAFNPADRNSAAFQVYSGGAWIGTGLGVNGNATITGSLTAGSFGTVKTTTIDSGGNTELVIKRNNENIASTFVSSHTNSTGGAVAGTYNWKGLSINGTDSYLATPNHPRFSYGLNATVSSVGTINAWGHVILGSASFSSGVFTAPVGGCYRFVFTGMTTRFDTDMTFVTLQVNAVSTVVYSLVGVVTNANETLRNRSLGFNIIITLSAGDSVRLRLGSGQLYGDPGAANTIWTGELISAL